MLCERIGIMTSLSAYPCIQGMPLWVAHADDLEQGRAATTALRASHRLSQRQNLGFE